MSEFNQDPTKLDFIKDGRYTYYDDEDESLLVKNYKDGKLNGPSYFHYVSGELWIETNFQDGLEHGILNYYEKDGSVIKTETWEKGECISTNHPGRKEEKTRRRKIEQKKRRGSSSRARIRRLPSMGSTTAEPFSPPLMTGMAKEYGLSLIHI